MTFITVHEPQICDMHKQTRPDSLETKALYKFFAYLLTYLNDVSAHSSNN